MRDESIPIDHKDEYASLRQEMLERFARIHDTAKYGIVGFIAIIGFYYSRGDALDPTFVLLILQSLVILIGFSTFGQYQLIFTLGAYIAVVIEKKSSKARYHMMNRFYKEYLEDNANQKEKWWNKLLPPWWSKNWYTDPLSISYLILVLPVFGGFAVYLKTGCWNVFVSDSFHIFLFIISIFTFGFNMYMFYKLRWGMIKFKKETTDDWWRYSEVFDPNKFPNGYK